MIRKDRNVYGNLEFATEFAAGKSQAHGMPSGVERGRQSEGCRPASVFALLYVNRSRAETGDFQPEIFRPDLLAGGRSKDALEVLFRFTGGETIARNSSVGHEDQFRRSARGLCRRRLPLAVTRRAGVGASRIHQLHAGETRRSNAH